MIKRTIVSACFIFTIALISFSKNLSDSLVKLSDLKFHSDFEKASVRNYLSKATDTFNIFLSIDENMNIPEAMTLRNNFKNIYNVLDEKKLVSKNIIKKIKIIYPVVHKYFLKKYSNNNFFPSLFKTGLYNCVTASILYAIVFDYSKIPYKVMASAEHAYLIANPGENSIVIETTNPDFELAIFNGEFKQQYVNYLHNSRQISEDEFKNKSTEEIFEERFNQVKEVNFNNMVGIQYYNKALQKFQESEIKGAYELSQKAYFFYPDIQIRALLNNSLLFLIEKCRFEQVSDIDYLAQLSRFENIDPDVVTSVFNNILNYYLQYNDKQEYVESLFQRLAQQIENKTLLEEISFSYYLRMGRQFFQTIKAEYYIINAVKIKSNHNDANILLKAFIYDKFNRMNDPQAMLDTLQRFDNQYHFEQIVPLLNDFRKIAWLKMADELYKDNNIEQGEKYLLLFENNCDIPIENLFLEHSIEATYRSIAVYYYYKNQKSKAKSYIERALNFVPNSILVKSAIYQ